MAFSVHVMSLQLSANHYYLFTHCTIFYLSCPQHLRGELYHLCVGYTELGTHLKKLQLSGSSQFSAHIFVSMDAPRLVFTNTASHQLILYIPVGLLVFFPKSGD